MEQQEAFLEALSISKHFRIGQSSPQGRRGDLRAVACGAGWSRTKLPDSWLLGQRWSESP